MLNVIIVMGGPGTGKSTLVREFMKTTAPYKAMFEDVKLVPFHVNSELGVLILGKYEDGEVFAGTDRMSMAVQPEAVKFLKDFEERANNDGQDWTVLFEGDRLTNQSFIEFCIDNFNTTVFYLEVTKEERERRFVLRGSNQSEQFIRGRETKYSRLMSNFSVQQVLEKHQHETQEDMDNLILTLVNKMGIGMEIV